MAQQLLTGHVAVVSCEENSEAFLTDCDCTLIEAACPVEVLIHDKEVTVDFCNAPQTMGARQMRQVFRRMANCCLIHIQLSDVRDVGAKGHLQSCRWHTMVKSGVKYGSDTHASAKRRIARKMRMATQYKLKRTGSGNGVKVGQRARVW